MKKVLAIVALAVLSLTTPVVMNGPDPVPACKKGSPQCPAFVSDFPGNGPDPVPACKKGSPQCP